MNKLSAWFPVLAGLVYLLVASWADRLARLLEGWAGATFEFQRAYLGATGLALLFGLATVIFLWVIFGRSRFDRWVFGLLTLLGILIFSLFPFTMVVPIGNVLEALFGRLLSDTHLILSVSPRSYLGMASTVIFWAGVGGFLWRSKGD